MKPQTANFRWKNNDLYLGSLYVGGVIPMKPYRDQFRVWFMSTDEGDTLTDDCKTLEEGKAILIKHVEEAINDRI